MSKFDMRYKDEMFSIKFEVANLCAEEPAFIIRCKDCYMDHATTETEAIKKMKAINKEMFGTYHQFKRLPLY